MPDAFATSVTDAGGLVIERFNQSVTYPNGGGRICVPLSIMWLKYQVLEVPTPLPKRFVEWLAATDASVSIQSILNQLNAEVDTPISVWEGRNQAATDIAARAHNSTRVKTAATKRELLTKPDMFAAVETIVFTSPAGQVAWPAFLDTPDWADEKHALTTVADKVDQANHETRMAPWRDIITYACLGPLVALHTNGKFALQAPVVTFDGAPSLADDFYNGLRLLCIYNLTTTNDAPAFFQGHMMAVLDEPTGRLFFDPNQGYVLFNNLSSFRTWFASFYQTNYAGRYPTGGFVKTFVPVAPAHP
jgi:hypothetical protein